MTIIADRKALESFNHDGLEIARRRGARPSVAVGPILLFVAAVLSFKIFLMLHLGAATYLAKQTSLAEGGAIERFAATMMAMDPLSQWAAVELHRIAH